MLKLKHINPEALEKPNIGSTAVLPDGTKIKHLTSVPSLNQILYRSFHMSITDDKIESAWTGEQLLVVSLKIIEPDEDVTDFFTDDLNFYRTYKVVELEENGFKIKDLETEHVHFYENDFWFFWIEDD